MISEGRIVGSRAGFLLARGACTKFQGSESQHDLQVEESATYLHLTWVIQLANGHSMVRREAFPKSGELAEGAAVVSKASLEDSAGVHSEEHVCLQGHLQRALHLPPYLLCNARLWR